MDIAPFAGISCSHDGTGIAYETGYMVSCFRGQGSTDWVDTHPVKLSTETTEGSSGELLRMELWGMWI